MPKKTVIRKTHHQNIPTGGLNFAYKSYQYLCQSVEILESLNQHQILNNLADMQISNFQNIRSQNMKIKKLFHIDLKKNHVYWEVLKQSQRNIIKQCLKTKQTLYKWQFNETSIGFDKAIEVLGKWKCLELRKSSISKEQTLRLISLKVSNNSYFQFKEFYQDVVSLINSKLMEIYDGRILQKFKINHTNKKIYHQKIWEFTSLEITKIWKNFKMELQNQNISQNYQQAFFRDIQKLFNTNYNLKCEGGITSNPQRQKNKNQASFQTLSNLLQLHPINISSDLDKINRLFQKFPKSQNYPFIESYVSQNNQNSKAQQICRKSFKKPANKCNQHCACLSQNGSQCPNIQRKIECEHHNCLNSRIRKKNGVHCWYLDKQKNLYQIQRLKQKLTSGFQIIEYHSFGLDFHTVTLLYYLLPFHRIQDGQLIQNEREKKTIIEILIPYEVSKTQNLFDAVKKIASLKKYEKYHYEARILQRKLRFIKKMETQNLKSSLSLQNYQYPEVSELKCFYKGLGVINSGLKIPKNTLIGEFIGQTMPRYRIQQKQQLCAKLIKMKNSIKFYCIDAFTHLDETCEPRFFSVDPQNKGNFCRNLNHSCDPNCKVDVIVSQGKYVLGIHTTRQIQENEELTFDYMSITDDYQEFKKSVCLCSSLVCRGRYLRYQDQIYTDLDGTFLDKKVPIRKRIKHLIYSSKPIKHDSFTLTKKINQLKKRQINIQNVPQESQNWLLNWIEANEKIITKQLQFLQSKIMNQQGSNLRYSICQKSRVFDPKFGEKQKIATLNAKIQKISHYLRKINDFSPPFTQKSNQQLITKLQHEFSKSKFYKQKIKRQTKNQQNLKFKDNKVLQLRLNLFQAASYELTIQKNIDMALLYFQMAFTFINIQIHIYPDYVSEKIKIWRENLPEYEGNVEYSGEDFYILENLIFWAGQLKKKEKDFMQVQKSNKQLKKQMQKDLSVQLKSENNFRRQFLILQVKLAVFQIQEEKFKMNLPEEIKSKQSLSILTNLTKLKKDLLTWIQRCQSQYLNKQKDTKIFKKITKSQSMKKQKSIKKQKIIINELKFQQQVKIQHQFNLHQQNFSSKRTKSNQKKTKQDKKKSTKSKKQKVKKQQQT